MLPIFLLASLLHTVSSQTFTSCNPLSATCPADQALAGTANIDFTKGASDAFTVTGGSPTYNSDGMLLTVAQRGDAPTLTSKWYMMFGHIEVKMKAAPGVGIISSLVLQSDDLDEIDFEWIGGDSNKVQSNYFGKGMTLTYDRGAYHDNPNNHDWHTYTIDFTAEQIVWQVDGVTVRALTQSSAQANQYPQTPMQLKIGIWSGGDPSNSAGTIAWAGGDTSYGAGPYSMVVASVKATDYSTGTSYSYGDQSGSWQSIKSNGGTINGGSSPLGSAAGSSAPSVTEVSTGDPTPFGGTHRGSSSFVTPSTWPWVASATPAGDGSDATQTAYPGLPSGWTVTASGKVIPPSAACAISSSRAQPSPSSSSIVSVVVPEPISTKPAQTAPKLTTSSVVTTAVPTQAGSGSITTVVFNAQGFPTTIVVPAGWTKQYDSQGFLILPTGSPSNNASNGGKREILTSSSSRTSSVSKSSTRSSMTTATTKSSTTSDDSVSNTEGAVGLSAGVTTSVSSTSASATALAMSTPATGAGVHVIKSGLVTVGFVSLFLSIILEA